MIRLLRDAMATRGSIIRLRDTATDAAQAEWEQARWIHADACQQVHESCQRLIEAIDALERDIRYRADHQDN